MPRGIKNWTYKDVDKFLKEHDFEYSEERSPRGSHRYYFKKTPQKEIMVDVQYLTGKETYPPLTIKTFIRQSEIPQEEWRKWTKG